MQYRAKNNKGKNVVCAYEMKTINYLPAGTRVGKIAMVVLQPPVRRIINCFGDVKTVIEAEVKCVIYLDNELAGGLHGL